MKTPLPGLEGDALWLAFTDWCDLHAVPDEEEDWFYLWECFRDGATAAKVAS
tara:strand:+ start:375 stop:530 length:156 start_codon:yes stop_codon:yes gene_type:complete